MNSLDFHLKGSVAVLRPATAGLPAREYSPRAFGSDGACRHQPMEIVMKLTDSQLVILSAASRREDGEILPLPRSLKLNAGAVTLVLKSLLKHKLVVETEAANDMAAWREDEAGRRFALAITSAGLKAIGVDALPEAKDKMVPPKKAVPKETKSNAKVKPASQAKPSARAGTKLSLLIDLLRRKTGATIDEAVKATGWQKHSVRGAMSGALKKKMGLDVTSAAVEGRGRVYRIATL
jgi:hypothetical protein